MPLDPDRDKLIIEMTAVLEGLKKRGLTNEETAIILFQDVVGPYVEMVRDSFTRIMFVTGASYRAQ